MKSLSVKLGVILIGLSIFSYSEAWGANWKLYSETDFFSSYYDRETVNRTSENIVRVWVKEVNTEKGMTDMVNRFGEEFKNCDHIKKLYEIDCTEKRIRILSSAAYSRAGEVIISDDSPSKWISIMPKSEGEALHKTVCK